MSNIQYQNKEMHFWFFVIALVLLFLFSMFTFYNFGINNGMVQICDNMGKVATMDYIDDNFKCYTQEEIDNAKNMSDLNIKIQNANKVINIDGV